MIKPPSPTGADVAQSIKAGRADCGIAIRAVASAAGLGFEPVMAERFDLVVRQREFFRAPFQAFVRFMGAPAFAARAREMGGYDVSDAGEVRAAP
jgi:putative molybdopterin biosynthesis protein